MPKSYKVIEEEQDTDLDLMATKTFSERVKMIVTNKLKEENRIKEKKMHDLIKKSEEEKKKDLKKEKIMSLKKEGKKRKYPRVSETEEDCKEEDEEDLDNNKEEEAFLHIIEFSKERRKKQNETKYKSKRKRKGRK